MKAVLVVLIFCIVFLALFAGSNNTTKDNYVLKINNINIHSVEKQSFFAIDQSSQIRNQIEIIEDSIKIPEPIH